MVVGGLKHSEQRFNSRSTGVGSALLFISVGGKEQPLWWRLFNRHPATGPSAVFQGHFSTRRLRLGSVPGKSQVPTILQTLISGLARYMYVVLKARVGCDRKVAVW